jgi:hypothetical protein
LESARNVDEVVLEAVEALIVVKLELRGRALREDEM